MDKGKCPFFGVKFIELSSNTTHIRRGIVSKPRFPTAKEFLWRLAVNGYFSK